MAKYRQDQINEAIKQELSMIFREVKDPRVSNAFVSVTGVDCAADLSIARVYFSALSGDVKQVGKGLTSAMGFIRGQLSQRCRLRVTPELKFIPDDSIQHGAHINTLLRSVEDDLRPDEGEDGGDDDE